MDKEPNNKNRPSLQSIRESLRTLSLSTLLLIVTTAVALVAVGSLAWMSENRKLDADGIHANMQGERYSISFLENGANDGLYENKRQCIVGYDDAALVWKMTDESKIENFDSTADANGIIDDEGVYPGSSGYITFFATPNVDSVDLNLTFELCAYNGTSQLTLNQSDIAKFLNGHIMLFMNKDEESGKYSDPVLPDANGQRTYHLGAITQRQEVKVYWVWPLTLSTIIDASSNGAITIEPFFYNETSYTQTLENIRSFPDYYMKDVARPENEGQKLPASTIVNNYSYYGDCYDRADNDIGNSIQYVLVKMTVFESEAGGGGA